MVSRGETQETQTPGALCALGASAAAAAGPGEAKSWERSASWLPELEEEWPYMFAHPWRHLRYVEVYVCVHIVYIYIIYTYRTYILIFIDIYIIHVYVCV